jgi:serine phosphatase RsbU (regulator of sigma subunit)/anti-sigma regulatory factor (Ser/Thr protein kinase)
VAAPVDSQQPSVLLVDDRPENLLALEAVLGPLNVRLVSVGSGEAALRALLAEDFAVILLDVQMPGMDGFETAACIKQRERSRSIPIIFLTAISKDIGHVFRGYEAGAVDYLLKPFDPRILRSKVGVFCDLDRQRRARAVAETARVEAEAAFARERIIAEALQRELLPERLPDVPGLAVAARFRPGGPETQVGGDWYDAIALPGGRLGLVIGDVAGRGFMAAARMGQLRSVARAYALEGHAPAVVAERLNHYHVALGAEQMTTLVYAIVEPDNGRLRYANAGHPPPLLALPGEEPRLLTGVSPPLGASEIWRFEERELPFAPDATLVLYTDGLVERRSQGVDAGLERLRSTVARAGDAALERVCERLIAGSPAAAGADDDVTVLMVRCLPDLGTPARFILGPDPDALAAMRRTLRRWLKEAGVPDGERDGMIMAANEAWQNAIEHGNGFSRAPIDVEFALANGDVVVTVRDAGSPGGPSDPDRGRGLDLMRGLVDEATVELGPHGGVVTLRQGVGSWEDGADAVKPPTPVEAGPPAAHRG